MYVCAGAYVHWGFRQDAAGMRDLSGVLLLHPTTPCFYSQQEAALQSIIYHRISLGPFPSGLG